MTTDIKPDTTGLEYQSPEWFQAIAEIERGRRAGKVVEYDCENPRARTGWSSKNPSPDYGSGLIYRLKTEPRVVWVNFYSSGRCFHYASEDIARRIAEIAHEQRIATAVRVELPE